MAGHPFDVVRYLRPLAFIVLWLGLRWPFRRAILVSVVVGVVADALVDLVLTRTR